MLLIRILLLLTCLATTGWFLNREQQAGRFQRVDDSYLDFLVASAREKLSKPDPQAAQDVVFVRMREEEAKDYAAWPPAPLDWRTVLESLRAYEPSVVVIATPLNWGRPGPDFLPAVAEALLPFPSVVLGVEAQASSDSSNAPAFMGDLQDALPRFQRVKGDAQLAPHLVALITAPDPSLRPRGELGLVSARQTPEGWLVPYALSEGESLLPTALSQALARYTQSPYSLHRIQLGPGAGAYLQRGLFVPLAPSAEMLVNGRLDMPNVNALNLMTGPLVEGASPEDKVALGKGKVVVLGLDRDRAGDEPVLARLYAQALSEALAYPRIHILSTGQQWIVWIIAVLGSLGMVWRVPRKRVLMTGMVLVFAALVASFLVFEFSLIWFPPTLPLALLVVGILAASVLGVKSDGKEAAESKTEAETETAVPPSA